MALSKYSSLITKCHSVFTSMTQIIFVTSWDKISYMSQFFHTEVNIPVFSDSVRCRRGYYF